MLTHVYVERPGDHEEITRYIEFFSEFTHGELVDTFNKIKGVYGVHHQGLYFIALHHVFLCKFGKSPFGGDGVNVFSIGTPIVYIPDLVTFLPDITS